MAIIINDLEIITEQAEGSATESSNQDASRDSSPATLSPQDIESVLIRIAEHNSRLYAG